MFKTKIATFWELYFIILSNPLIFGVYLIFFPKVFIGMIGVFIFSLFFMKWWV